jgi:hypothetical protein
LVERFRLVVAALSTVKRSQIVQATGDLAMAIAQ